ncbi:MAG: hypothetical protein H7123_09515 [Thermoleophilia bacterium]|nr:hypothetical protein [Thermoleophilia bacterium]
MHDGWPYVAAAYVLIIATLALWFAMIVRRFLLVRTELAQVELEGAERSRASAAASAADGEPTALLDTLRTGTNRASELLTAALKVSPDA